MSTHIETEIPITETGLKAGQKASMGLRHPDFIQGAHCLVENEEEKWERRIEKHQLQTEAFNDDVELWAESMALRGEIPPEILKQRKIRTQFSYNRSKHAEREKHSKLIQDATKSNFQAVFNIRTLPLQELLRENGSTEEDIERTLSIWNTIFLTKMYKKQPIEEKKGEIQREIKHLDSEIDHLYQVRFPHYANSWETFLTKSGKSQEEAKQEANLWRTKFDNANDAEKAEISKDLRVRIMSAPSREFTSLVRDYSRLVDQGLVKPSRRGFISEKEWKDKFDGANAEDQMEILEALRFVMSRELDRVAEKKPETVFSS